jgi:hypothetical protein
LDATQLPPLQEHVQDVVGRVAFNSNARVMPIEIESIGGSRWVGSRKLRVMTSRVEALSKEVNASKKRGCCTVSEYRYCLLVMNACNFAAIVEEHSPG